MPSTFFLLAALGMVACTSPADSADTGSPPAPWAAPDEVGPYAAGAETFQYTDVRGKEMTMEVWYPAAPDAGDEPDAYPEISFIHEAYREAPADVRGAPYPLIAFSHGYSAIRYQSVFLTEYLAQHGYVVVAPDHPSNTFLDLDDEAVGQVMVERPDDIRYAVDELHTLVESEHERLGGMVDPAAGYGMTGHSFGAITTMVVVGAQMDGEAMVEYCAQQGGWICSLLRDVDPQILDMEIVGDDRARAPVAMAPGLWYAFGSQGEGLAPVNDILMMGGTFDDLFDYQDDIRPTYQAVSAPKALATLEGAGHYAFSDICEVAYLFMDECDGEGEGWIDIEQAHTITQVLVTAYMGVNLAGDERYAEWLEPAYLERFPELTLESEGM